MNGSIHKLHEALERVEAWRLIANMARDPRRRQEADRHLARSQSSALAILRSSLDGDRVQLAKAEALARRKRGRILEVLRDRGDDVGGDDLDAVLVREGVDANGVNVFDAESLDLIRETFEGAGLVVRKRGRWFDHLGPDCHPWPRPNTPREEAGFFHGLEVRPFDGRLAVVGKLHVFEAAPEVRQLIRDRHRQGKAVGLSIETPWPESSDTGEPGGAAPSGPKEVRRIYHALADDRRAERFPVVAVVSFPAAGGRILTAQEAEEVWREPAPAPVCENVQIRHEGKLYAVPVGARRARLPDGQIVEINP